MVTLFFLIALSGSLSVRSELPHIYSKIPRGKKPHEWRLSQVYILGFSRKNSCYAWILYPACYTETVWSHMLTSVPAQGFPLNPEGKQGISHISELTEAWEVRQSTGPGVMLDTSLDFLSKHKKSGCLWSEERLLGPKGNNELMWLLSHITKI